jgi:hypothetical protein
MEATENHLLQQDAELVSFTQRLWLTAYDARSQVVARETYPAYCAHGAWIELVDELESRIELGVRRINIEMRDANGAVKSAYTMIYDEAGTLTEAYQATTASQSAALMAVRLAERLRWIMNQGSDSVMQKSATINA